MLKLIKKQYEERGDKTTFKIVWYIKEHNLENIPIYPNLFKWDIEEFLIGIQQDKEVSLIDFRYCPFHFVKSIFVRFILCFPAMKELSFWNCTFSDENFQNFQKFKILKLNKLDIGFCNISEVSSFYSLLKSISVKDISFEEEVKNNVIVSAIRNYLKSNKRIKGLTYRHTEPSEKPLEEDIIELQEIVDSHPSIHVLQFFKTFLFRKGKSQTLEELVHSSLQSQYEDEELLKEVPVILMGDGRTGKTSLLRNLSGKSFQKEIQSTIVLEYYQIFQVNFNKFKPITKYDLSVQRVKNMLNIEYFTQDEAQKKSKYNLDFEDELLTRTIREKSFVDQYTTRFYDSDFITYDTFLRVYDFGGQEVFSSVHHIFMNKKAIYLVVFNLTKLKEKDLLRLKFWCESILRNTPKAPVLFIGTYLNTFLKKNKTLDRLNFLLESFISELSGNLTIFEDITTIFFPVENAIDSNNSREDAIKKELMSIYQLSDPYISIKSVYVLFLDNCQEESSYMTVQKFKLKAKKCNFSEEEMEEMLEIYSKEAIISYFKDINLSENENFIFFAPSFLAQALGSFIRDESFHQLAFRTNKKVFSNYRKYIDTGIIRKDLFEVLLKQYTKKERKYVLNLALHSLVLFTDPRERNAFIVPELLPEVKDSKLKISLTPDLVWKTDNPITREKFLKVVFMFLNHKKLQNSYLFKFFCRIIFGPDEILDILVIKESKLSFRFIGTERDGFLVSFIQQLIEESNVNEQEVEENYYLEDSISKETMTEFSLLEM
eukprot:snap_masked-scaffold_28-processed-gene-2.31-mRNA-1 protein AED:1.00 eAED:1.00 QI:0/0/0/0/1/1/7/0/770